MTKPEDEPMDQVLISCPPATLDQIVSLVCSQVRGRWIVDMCNGSAFLVCVLGGRVYVEWVDHGFIRKWFRSRSAERMRISIWAMLAHPEKQNWSALTA